MTRDERMLSEFIFPHGPRVFGLAQVSRGRRSVGQQAFTGTRQSRPAMDRASGSISGCDDATSHAIGAYGPQCASRQPVLRNHRYPDLLDGGMTTG